jgi:hypothetical protein
MENDLSEYYEVNEVTELYNIEKIVEIVVDGRHRYRIEVCKRYLRGPKEYNIEYDVIGWKYNEEGRMENIHIDLPYGLSAVGVLKSAINYLAKGKFGL